MPSSIKTYDFKPGLLAEIELIPISSIFQQHEPILTKPHRADFYHIFWFTKGTPVHTVDFIPIAIQPNTLLFVARNRVQFFDRSGQYDGWVLLFTDAFFNQNPLDAQFLRHTILFRSLVDVPLVQLDQLETDLIPILHQLQNEYAQPDDGLHLAILKNLLHNLLMLADREHRKQGASESRKGPHLDYTLAFTELLEKQFINHQSVRQYAKQLGITERRLQQATAEAVGKTPKQLIDERLLLEAKRLLVHTNQSIKEIAFTLGFEEPTHFSRLFRHHLAQTPAQFRKGFAV
ncbi:helix-turn-helix transcriptional regulator [Spirosoma linguale]|uniref:Transcriptional regulator, AraC family n=1 Tax=Spirosoma linguale (strain ATCC 33905 / DSM 74 / LMG 10896 / Claus 1) TaxID=504472 RepID=D2QRH0_SPILD|nr:transcriptional regulator, AraC family [Spirosoma linguale DSM 74]